MSSNRFHRRLAQIEAHHPADGWRRWAAEPVENWPDHALESCIMESVATMVGAAVPPRLAQVAVGRLEFLHLLIAHNAVGARRFLRDLAGTGI